MVLCSKSVHNLVQEKHQQTEKMFCWTKARLFSLCQLQKKHHFAQLTGLSPHFFRVQVQKCIPSCQNTERKQQPDKTTLQAMQTNPAPDGNEVLPMQVGTAFTFTSDYGHKW